MTSTVVFLLLLCLQQYVSKLDIIMENWCPIFGLCLQICPLVFSETLQLQYYFFLPSHHLIMYNSTSPPVTACVHVFYIQLSCTHQFTWNQSQSAGNEASLLRDLKERRLQRQSQLSPLIKPVSVPDEIRTTEFVDAKETTEQVITVILLVKVDQLDGGAQSGT